MRTSVEPPLPDSTPVMHGMIGMLNLHGGSIIAFVSKAKQVNDVSQSASGPSSLVPLGSHDEETSVIIHRSGLFCP